MGLLALFGQPVAHSISPWLHQRFAERCGIELDYRLVETIPGTLETTLERFAEAGGIGGNVTLPLKAEALDCCAGVTPRADQAGAVNTLKRTVEGWRGDNTDGAGFLHDLTQSLGFDPAGKRLLIAGAGGAARAVLYALLSTRAISLFIANRAPERAQTLARATQDPRVAGCPYGVLGDMEPFDLVINATSAGHAGESPPLPGGILAAGGWCYDLSYGKPALPFLRWAETHKAARAVDGRGMLIEQGALSFEWWFDIRPDTKGLRDAFAGARVSGR